MVSHAYAKLPVQDTERARAFYRDALGLEPYAENHGHLYYDVTGVPLLLFPSVGSPSGNHDQFGFVVEDLSAFVARLRDEGVQLEEFPAPPGATMQDRVMDRGFMKAAWFKDSEGNLLSVAQFATGSPFRREAVRVAVTAGSEA